MKHNGTAADGPLDMMIDILERLDGPGFRIISEAGPEISDDDILEAMHLARMDNQYIDRAKRMDSKRWIYRRKH